MKMKKAVFLSVLLLSGIMSLMAENVVVDFNHFPYADGMISEETQFPDATLSCTWTVNYVRHKESDDHKVNGKYGLWFAGTNGSGTLNYGYIQSQIPVCGGIHSIAFSWKQFGAEADQTMKMNLYVGENSTNPGDPILLFSQSGVGGSTPYPTHDIEQTVDYKKASAFVKLINATVKTAGGAMGNNKGRILIGDITIIPYISFSTTEVSLSRGEQYTNTTYPAWITTNGDAITWSVVRGGAYVDINTTTGQVTARALGTAVVRATLAGGAYAEYTIRVDRTTENFTPSDNQTTGSYNCNESKTFSYTTWTLKSSGIQKTGTPDDFYVQFRGINTANSETSADYPSLTSASISGGISSFSIRYAALYTESALGSIKVYINDVQVGEITAFSDKDWHTLEVSDLDITGNFVIRIVNESVKTSPESTKNYYRMKFDNLTWTSNSSSCDNCFTIHF